MWDLLATNDFSRFCLEGATVQEVEFESTEAQADWISTTLGVFSKSTPYSITISGTSSEYSEVHVKLLGWSFWRASCVTRPYFLTEYQAVVVAAVSYPGIVYAKWQQSFVVVQPYLLIFWDPAF